MARRRGRKRVDATVTLPGSIFQTLRAVGIADLAIVRAIGVPRSTVNRASAGITWEVMLSREEFSKLNAFVSEKLTDAQAAAAALAASQTQFELFES